MYRQSKKYFPTLYALLVALIIITYAVTVTFLIFLNNKFGIARIVLYGLKIFAALSIISSSASEKSKCSWLTLILLFPNIIIPAYFIFCYNPLSKSEKKAIGIISKQKPRIDHFSSKANAKCNQNFSFLREIANYDNAVIYKNTKASYISSASKMKEMLLGDIKGAKSFIFLEFYTVATGDFFGDICDALIKKAKEGVEVRLIYDEMGSIFRIPENFSEFLESKNIIALSHAHGAGMLPAGFNNRNHRKIAVIDGEIGYTGGINLADEYISPKKRIGEWRDSAVRLEGEAVAELVYIFLSDFALTSKVTEDFFHYYRYRKKRHSGKVMLFGDGPKPFYKTNTAKKVLISMLNSAEKYFIATTPYLICDSEMLSVIESAVLRGVKVKIAIPFRPDKFIPAFLTKIYARRLIELGVEIYRYLPGFLHSKNYISDGKYFLTGTVNLDFRSLLHNFEVGALFYEHEIISDAEADAAEIFKASERYEPKGKPLISRIVGSVMEIFAPLF